VFPLSFPSREGQNYLWLLSASSPARRLFLQQPGILGFLPSTISSVFLYRHSSGSSARRAHLAVRIELLLSDSFQLASFPPHYPLSLCKDFPLVHPSVHAGFGSRATA
jgi:hypothetical protein